jgi:hypothetical protein
MPDPDKYDLTTAESRLIRAWVRREGSLSAVNENLKIISHVNQRDYAINFASYLFKSTNFYNYSTAMMLNETPYRQAIIEFPSQPAHDVSLNVKVLMKPASGLAKVTFSPDDASVFDGRDIRLNFASMTKITEEKLPKQANRGWPELTEILIDPSGVTTVSKTNLINYFLITSAPKNIEKFKLYYKQYFVHIIDSLIKKARLFSINKWDVVKKTGYEDQKKLFKVYPISEEGLAGNIETNKLIKSFTKRVELLFTEIKNNKLLSEIIYHFIAKASFLYLSTPKSIVDFIRHQLKNHNILLESRHKWNYIIKAAGRVFSDIEDIKLIFEAIVYRINFYSDSNLDTQFPIDIQKTICVLLVYRKNTIKSLRDTWIRQIATKAKERSLNESYNENYQLVFHQCVLVLEYLLRYRESNLNFLSKKNVKIMDLYNEVINILNSYVAHFNLKLELFQNLKKITPNDLNDTKIKYYKSFNIRKEFIDYLNYESTIDVPIVLTESALDDDE